MISKNLEQVNELTVTDEGWVVEIGMCYCYIKVVVPERHFNQIRHYIIEVAFLPPAPTKTSYLCSHLLPWIIKLFLQILQQTHSFLTTSWAMLLDPYPQLLR